MKNLFIAVLSSTLLSGVLSLGSCDNQQFDSEIPFVAFPDMVINLTSQKYLELRNPLGHVEIDAGLRGIIIITNSAVNEYTAFERNCSYQPNNACAQVEVDASGLSLHDQCCGSTFDIEFGNPFGGPATSPLRRYRTLLDGNILTITDVPLN
jgi:nitrite reductase/ring-hydroxylating ferredoxin subunit